ncbi:hypothetical protein GLOIN_2v1526861, partial [Rhizophagus irregularis DAOM 181602=DAOM 197198]
MFQLRLGKSLVILEKDMYILYRTFHEFFIKKFVVYIYCNSNKFYSFSINYFFLKKKCIIDSKIMKKY